MKNISQRRPGYALATILILLGVSMFAAAGIISISILESKISRSQREGITAYYAAEAGVEDALWRINNTSSYANALVSGTLDQSYTATNVPVAGEGFSVRVYTDPAKGAGYAIIDVTGTSNNGTFTAQRKIQTNVFQGTVTPPTGTNAFFSGGNISITNGNGQITIVGGDFYASTSIKVNSAKLNASGQIIQTVGTYASNAGSTVSGTIHSSNNPPATTAISAPGIDFTYYKTNNNRYYSSSAFTNLFSNGCTVNLAGPVTFVDGSVLLNSNAKNCTLNVTGMLIVNGNFTVTNSASGFKVNVNDPGTGKAGIFVRTDLSMSQGSWNVNGVVFASGKITFNNTSPGTIDGGFIAGGDVTMNTGANMTIKYNPSRISASFGTGSPLSVQVQHWEEEY